MTTNFQDIQVYMYTFFQSGYKFFKNILGPQKNCIIICMPIKPIKLRNLANVIFVKLKGFELIIYYCEITF